MEKKYSSFYYNLNLYDNVCLIFSALSETKNIINKRIINIKIYRNGTSLGD